MFHAVEGNQLALVMLFRQCNANLELTNYAGITALMAAQAKGFSEASSVLMVGLDPKAIIEHKEKDVHVCEDDDGHFIPFYSV